MNINYNVDHKLFALPIFQEKMTNTQRYALWITLSQIVHFSKHSKSCTFYQGQMSEDFGIRADFFSKAIKLLIKYKYIKCLRPYDRKTLSAAVYQWDTGYISLRANLYPSESKPVSHRDTVNNYVNNYKPQDDDFDQSSLVNGKESQPSPETKPNPILEEWYKLQENKKDIQ
jgi:hypothetical protein